MPAYQGDQLLGYVYLNSDFTNAIGYSGKPIHMLVGIDPQGIVRGIKLVDHKEPIVLVGIPERRIVDAMNTLIGKDLRPVATGAERPPQVDIVSGATVTVLVMGDSVVRSAVRLIRSGRLGAGGQAAAAAAAARRGRRPSTSSKSEIRDWETLVGDGSVRRLSLTIGEVNEAFAKAGNQEAADNPETGRPERHLHRPLRGAGERARPSAAAFSATRATSSCTARLKPGQQAIIVAGDGAYSFKGSGYVRGGIFDRIELLQDGPEHPLPRPQPHPPRRPRGGGRAGLARDRALRRARGVHARPRPSRGSCSSSSSATSARATRRS